MCPNCVFAATVILRLQYARALISGWRPIQTRKELSMAILAFDIETANVFDLQPGEDLDDYGPFDITVAATHLVGGDERLWLTTTPDGKLGPNMSQAKAQEFLGYLELMQRQGHAIVAWNGLSFDLRWIAHVAGDLGAARRIAMKMYDPMFQFFKLKGYPIGLGKVGEGFGIEMKKLMSGADAPKQWKAGNHQAVCDYVVGDTRLTAQIVAEIERQGFVRWITARGKASAERMPKLRTVEDCLNDPMPDQSWMDEPIQEERFTGWLS